MSGYGPLATAAGRALEPLAAALADPGACTRLLAELGVEEIVDEAALDRVRTLVGAADDLARLPGLVADLDTPGAGDAALIAEIIAATTRVVGALQDLGGLGAEDVTGLPGLLSRPEVWSYLAAALPDLLLSRQLARSAPGLFGVLRLLGVCVSEGPAHALRHRWRWDHLGDALADPVAAVRENVGWDARFAAWGLQREVGLTLARLGLPVSVRQMSVPVAEAIAGEPVDSTSGLESGVVLFRGEAPGGALAEIGLVFACTPDGGGTIYVGNQASGELTEAVQITPAWWLEVAGAIDGAATLGARVQPGGLTLVGGDAAIGASVAFDGRPTEPWLLVGAAGATRVELDGARIELGVAGTSGDAEAYVLARVADDALRVVLDLGAGDAFLRGVIGGIAPAITAGGEMRWGSRSGLTFGGGLGLAVTLPLDKQLGPLHVASLSLALGASPTGARLEATTVADITIGPLVGTVQNIGAALELASAPADGELGGLSALLAFIPPTGLGIGIDAEGIVTGGGFLDLDHEAGRYSGVATLQMLGLGLTATGIVETRLPGDPDGWSLFLSIIADFTPIQLGFGFTLNGVGGFMGLHRTLDEIALADGVREGRLDSVLFPEDALANAAQILADVQAFFPTLPDHHTFGAMAHIGWGTPTLIDAELGVILSVPDFEIAVIGEIGTVLPREDLPLLELHMCVAGFIDVAEGTMWVLASIHDSQLVQIDLSGDMALYVSVGAQPYFLLSVGGFHPGWSAPPAVPSSMRALRRMSASIDLGEGLQIGIESYFAVTANTLQFGAEVFAHAAARTLGVDFSADGWFGFDVLITFSPFTLQADMSAGVAIRAEGETLMGVQLSLHVEGPDPWYGSGYAEFEFFGFDAHFQVEVGGRAGPELPTTVELWPQLEQALADPESWLAPDPAQSLPEVTLRALDPVAEPGLWLDSDGRVEVRQRVLPLNREIEVYGTLVPEGETRFEVEAAGLASGEEAAWEPAQDWFAPAQFTRMTAADRLDAPSFELMDGGVTLVAEGLTVPAAAADAASVVLDYEEKVQTEEGTTATVIKALPADRLGLGLRSPVRSAMATGMRYRVATTPLGVAPTRYVLVEPLDAVLARDTFAAATGPLRDGGLAYADALGGRRALADSSAFEDGRLRIVPLHAHVGLRGIEVDIDIDVVDLPGGIERPTVPR